MRFFTIMSIFKSLKPIFYHTQMLVLILTLLGCQTKKEVTVLRVAHGLDEKHSVHLALVHLGERLQALSKGDLSVVVYPNRQLGNERELLELTQIGAIDITKVSASVLENFAPKYRVLSVPYLFNSREHAFRVLDGEVGSELLNSGKNYWLQGLGFYDSGSRSFYTKARPVTDPSQLKGLKIRTQKSPSAIELVNALGASATPIPFAELYTALQAGMVDGAENNPPSFYLTRHYELCKYYALDEHTRIPDVLLISTHAFDRLNDQQKVWLGQAVQESVDLQRNLWEQAETEALAAVQAAGVEIHRPSKAAFQTQLTSMIDAFQRNADMSRLIQEIRSTP